MEVRPEIPRRVLTQGGEFVEPKSKFNAHKEYVVQALRRVKTDGGTYLDDLISRVVDTDDENEEYLAKLKINKMIDEHYLDIESEDLDSFTKQIGNLRLEKMQGIVWSLDSKQIIGVKIQSVLGELITKLLETPPKKDE